jgi:L-lactate dehydrogenase complex protein LldG
MQDQSDRLASSERAEVFLGALRNVHAVPYVTGDAKSTVDILRTIISQSDARLVVAGDLPTYAKMLVESGLKGTRHHFVKDLKSSEALGILSRADVGISWARFGAARQGAVVEVADDDAVKLVSSLPRVSVFLLSSQSLLPDVSAALARVAELLRTAGEKKPVISVIAGPSKTADIELRLLYGVHGPHELHVILLEWI